MDATEELTRVLSLAQARLGDYARASQRLEALIAQQEAANIIGLHLGASYEARTRIAIWASDREAVTKYGKLTAQAYAHGQGSPLGARYERLMSEAHTQGVNVELALTKFEASMFGTTTLGRTVVSSAMANVTLRNAVNAHERAERALRMICDATGAHTAQFHIIEPTGLRVVASLGAPHETGSYEDVARLCLERACDADVGATQAASDEGSPAAGGTAGHSTVFYEPPTPRAILLTARHAEAPHHAAMVVLDPSARGVTTRDQHELFAAIAGFLLSVGDTPGVPAND
jgi:hypothetical protein